MQRGNLFIIITLMSLQIIIFFFNISEYDLFFCRSHAVVTKSKRCQKGCRITTKVIQTSHELYCIALWADKNKTQLELNS